MSLWRIGFNLLGPGIGLEEAVMRKNQMTNTCYALTIYLIVARGVPGHKEIEGKQNTNRLVKEESLLGQNQS